MCSDEALSICYSCSYNYALEHVNKDTCRPHFSLKYFSYERKPFDGLYLMFYRLP